MIMEMSCCFGKKERGEKEARSGKLAAGVCER
jgi:hypothetical protein